MNGGWYAHWITEGFAGCLVPQVFNTQRFKDTQPSKQGDAG